MIRCIPPGGSRPRPIRRSFGGGWDGKVKNYSVKSSRNGEKKKRMRVESDIRFDVFEDQNTVSVIGEIGTVNINGIKARRKKRTLTVTIGGDEETVVLPCDAAGSAKINVNNGVLIIIYSRERGLA